MLKEPAQRCVTNQIMQLNVLTFYLLLMNDKEICKKDAETQDNYRSRTLYES